MGDLEKNEQCYIINSFGGITEKSHKVVSTLFQKLRDNFTSLKYASEEKEVGKNPPITEFHTQVLGTGTIFPCKTGHALNVRKIKDGLTPTHWKTRNTHYLSVLAKTHVLEKIIYKTSTFHLS